MYTKDDIMKIKELISLQCFHELISDHVQSGI